MTDLDQDTETETPHKLTLITSHNTVWRLHVAIKVIHLKIHIRQKHWVYIQFLIRWNIYVYINIYIYNIYWLYYTEQFLLIVFCIQWCMFIYSYNFMPAILNSFTELCTVHSGIRNLCNLELCMREKYSPHNCTLMQHWQTESSLVWKWFLFEVWSELGNWLHVIWIM